MGPLLKCCAHAIHQSNFFLLTIGAFSSPLFLSRTTVGQDLRGRLWASVTWHRNWEYINARRHPEGGYHLMVKHWNEMVNIEAVDGGRRLVRSNEATVWEFVKVY